MKQYKYMPDDKQNRDYYKLQKTYLKKQGGYSRLLNDADPGDLISRGITDRDLEYTELLQNYVELSHRRNSLKEIHKWSFFWVVIGLCIVFSIYIIRFIVYGSQSLFNDNQFSSELLVALVSALASLVSVIIAVPIIISKYLFNTKEDDNITEIIKGTQVHDSKEITLLSEYFEKRLDNRNGKVVQPFSIESDDKTDTNDEDIEEIKKMI